MAGLLPEGVGDTPLVFADGVYVKLECANAGGSVKDRVAAFMLNEARRRGELRPGDTVLETTSGNTGIALALMARRLGHKLVLFMPEHMSAERRRMMEAAGAEVRLTPRAESFAGAVARRDEHRGRPGCYIPDQFSNPDNVRCHYLTTGAEIVRQLATLAGEQVDWFLAGVGTGGTLMGVGRRLREAFPRMRIAAVEPAESAVMGGGEPGDHGIMGIGDGFIPDLVDMNEIDEVVAIPSDDAHAEAERIRRVHGHCVGRSAGANMLAARRLRTRGAVVTVWPDCSDRYGSIGLADPTSEEVRCPFKESCEARMRTMLGNPTGPDRTS